MPYDRANKAPPRFPPVLRKKVQDSLTLAWTNKFPLLQPTSPAALVSRVIQHVLGPRVAEYVYVDFCSGAGGPTPYIERFLNAQLSLDKKDNVRFVMTDISPHVSAWSAAAKKSDNLTYVPDSVDATDAPPADTLLQNLPDTEGKKKIMRLFSLSFHHFDDDMAVNVLRNTVETSDGLCIFELQSRNVSSFVTVSLLWPMFVLIAPFFFHRDPVYLFFTYLVPCVPFVLVWDGYVSILRTRTPDEVRTLLREAVAGEDGLAKWKFESGEALHTWPIGWLSWIICCKED